MVWERTAHWARRLAELLAAIILAKFTIAVAFAVAASAIRGSRGDAGGLTGVLAGCAVLLVAALTPWALLKLIPFMEAAAGRGLHPRTCQRRRQRCARRHDRDRRAPDSSC